MREETQERMCELCEAHIIEGNSVTQHFMCEGRFCEDAFELLQDDKDYRREILNLKIKKVKLWKRKQIQL